MPLLQLPAPSEVLDEFAIVVLPLSEVPDEYATASVLPPTPRSKTPEKRVDG